MKKIIPIIVIVIVILIIALGGYFIMNKNQNKSQSKVLTAEDIANELKNKVSHVGKIVIYTEETDLNNLLGRPNQYTSKITFEDTRLEQTNANNEFLTEEERNEPTGGTIEVFNNKEDMQKRKEYIESISSSLSIFNQYIYSKGNALLRLENELTPEQAKEYENAFYEIIK